MLDALLVSEGFTHDPYLALAQLREHAPVYWFDHWGCWLVTRYAEVSEVLRNDADFSAVGRPGFGGPTTVNGEQRTVASLLNTDPPEHSRLRAIETPHFTTKAVGALRAELAALVDALLDDVAGSAELDFASEVATPVALHAAALVLGIDVESIPDWIAQDHTMMFESLGLPPESAAALEVAAAVAALPDEARMGGVHMDHFFHEYFVPIVDAGAEHGPALSALCRAYRDGAITRDELMAYAGLLLQASVDNTRSFLCSAVKLLLEHPAVLSECRADPDLFDLALEEALRLEPPVQRIPRRATRELTLGGVNIPRDAVVMTMIGSANRDPNAFDRPDVFDIHRSSGRSQLAFSKGRHLCLGAALARLEAAVVVPALFARFTSIRMRDKPQWLPRREVRAVSGLNLIVG
jgi:cytochrome P450